MSDYRFLMLSFLLTFFLDDSLVHGKISIFHESEAVTRRRELRAAMGQWSQSLASTNDSDDEKEFKELKAESSPLGVIEAGRYLIDRDVLNRLEHFPQILRLFMSSLLKFAFILNFVLRIEIF